MDSALRPRDIQARIRAGESLEDVARAAGVPAERIEAFAAPVIAEREHVAGLAQIHPVRRRGETSSHRTLRLAVADSLAQRGIDPADVQWDAWKLEDRRWQVLAAYQSGSRRHEALFVYEQAGRFSTAANDDARWLVGEDSHGSQPGRRPADARVDDELAIVRAVQGPAAPPRPGSDAGRAAPAGGQDLSSDAEDAYVEGELAEVDGVYDIVPAEATNLDVLYDMLSSFDEDSVKIYSGLVHPDQETTGVVIDAPLGEVAELFAPLLEPESADAEASEVSPDAPPPDAPAPVTRAEAPDPEDAPAIEGDLTAAEHTIVLGQRRPRPPRPGVTPAPGEPEQPTLTGDADPASAARKPARRRRASVPSWDEIMFGSPHQDK